LGSSHKLDRTEKDIDPAKPQKQPPPTLLFLVSTTNNVKEHDPKEGPSGEKALPHHHPFCSSDRSLKNLFDCVSATSGTNRLARRRRRCRR
ncbi:hypothetical protein, partial [Jiella mangrovi]